MKKSESFYKDCSILIEQNRYEKLPYRLFKENGLLKNVDERLVEVVEEWLFMPSEATYEMCEKMFPGDMICIYEVYYLDIPYEDLYEIKSLYDLAYFLNKHCQKWGTLEEVVKDYFVKQICWMYGWDIVDEDEIHFRKTNKLITTKANENPLMVLYFGAKNEGDEYKDYEFFVKEVEV